MEATMNLTDKLKNTSSSHLMDRIKNVEEELSRLVAAHDQAEADAIARAGEDAAYQKAAGRAAELSRQVTEKRERLDRLRTARETALACEQEESIKKLRSKHEELVSARDRAKKDIDRLRAVEDSRHKKETNRLDRLMADADLAAAEAEIALDEQERNCAAKAVADAEASGNHDDLVFHKGCLQRRENALRNSQAKRGHILASNVGA